MEMFKLLSTLIVILTISHNANGEDLEDQKLQPYNNEHNQLALSRAKRMYAMCPPDFIKIGNECYYMSVKKESWLDAHFECKDRNSKLAEPLKFADKKIRKYLTNKDLNKGEKWIGGMYNWERMIWQWGYNGKAMTYQSFSNMGAKTNEELKFHCTTLNPEFSYKWSSKMCSEKHYFICQHHLTTVSEKERVDVYNKWNETYPHQMANEIVVYLKGTSNRNRDTVKVEVSTVKNIDDSFVLDSRNTDLHPVHNSHAIAHGQNVKPKKRHSELKLTGEVNLGIDKRDRKRARKQPGGLQKGVKTTTSAASPERTPTTTTEQSSSTSLPTTTPTTTTEQSLDTTTPITTTQGSSTINSKAARIERLKERLAKLSPEDKQEYLQMKRERLETKKKYNQTI